MRTPTAIATSIAAALEAAAAPRDKLNEIDTEISSAIDLVEKLLVDLRPGIPTSVSYETEDGRFFLHYEKHNGHWCIMHSSEADDDPGEPLRSMPRHVRAEVWTPRGDMDAPIVRLFPAIVESLKEIIASRQIALAGAEQVVIALRPTLRTP